MAYHLRNVTLDLVVRGNDNNILTRIWIETMKAVKALNISPLVAAVITLPQRNENIETVIQTGVFRAAKIGINNFSTEIDMTLPPAIIAGDNCVVYFKIRLAY